MSTARTLPPGIRRRTGKFQVRYYNGGYLRARTFDKVSDAIMFKTTVEADKIRGDLPNPKLSTVRLRDWADQWLAELTHLKPKTRASYGSALRTHVMPALGHIPIGKLQQSDVAGWVKQMAEKGVSGSRIRESYKVLRAMLVVADQRNMIRRSPCFGIRLPHQGRREPRFLTAEQVRDIAERIADPYRTLVYLLAYGGLRWGEACALRCRRVHLDKQRLTVAESLAEVNGEFHWGETKTGRIRTVAIPRFLCALLAAQLEGLPDDPDALIFTAPDGSPLRNNWFHRRVWDPARDAADVPSDLRIHDLRHTCASLLISQGAHPKMIQSHLGHSTIAVTFDVYGHIFDADRDALVDGLDAIYAGIPRGAMSIVTGSSAAS
jgi:integrase